MKPIGRKVLSLVLAAAMLLSLTVTAYAADTWITPREQARQNEVTGTAYVGNGIMLMSADGINADVGRWDQCLHFDGS